MVKERVNLICCTHIFLEGVEFSWLEISAREGVLCEFVSETSGSIKNKESLLFFPTSRGVSAILLHAAQFQRLLLGVLFSAFVIT
jgi:hypothetical protein